MKNLRSGMFTGCSALATVAGCDGISSIESGAFDHCISLSSIGSGDNEVGNYNTEPVAVYEGAFYGCSSLQAVCFRNGCGLMTNAFYGCTSLEAVSAASMNINYITRGDGIFQECRSLQRLCLPDDADASPYMVIGSPGPWSFGNCSALTTVLDFFDAYQVHEHAFDGCASIPAVQLPNAMTIGQYAFNGCAGMYYCDAPAVRTISGHAFENCSGMYCCAAPLAQTIDGYAFAGCGSLTSMFGSNGEEDVHGADLYCSKYIGEHAFEGAGLTSVNAKWCAYVGDAAFKNCAGLQTANFSLYDVDGHPNAENGSRDYWRVWIGDEAFAGCSQLTDFYAPKARRIGSGALSGTSVECFFNYEDECPNEMQSAGGDQFDSENYNLDHVQLRTSYPSTLEDLRYTSNGDFWGMRNDARIIGSYFPTGGDSSYTVGYAKQHDVGPETWLRAASEKYCEVSAWMHLGIPSAALPVLSSQFVGNPAVENDYYQYVNYIEILRRQYGEYYMDHRRGHGAPMWKYHPRYDGYTMDEYKAYNIPAIYQAKKGMLYDSYDTEEESIEHVYPQI